MIQGLIRRALHGPPRPPPPARPAAPPPSAAVAALRQAVQRWDAEAAGRLPHRRRVDNARDIAAQIGPCAAAQGGPPFSVVRVEQNKDAVLLFLELDGRPDLLHRSWVAKVTRERAAAAPGAPRLDTVEHEALGRLERVPYALPFVARAIGSAACAAPDWSGLPAAAREALELVELEAATVRVLLIEGVSGRSLSDELERRRRTPADLAVLLAQGVFALAAFEQVGLAHNDLHLENLLVAEAEEPAATVLRWPGGAVRLPASRLSLKIIDFDLAGVNGRYPAEYGEEACHAFGACAQPGRDLAQFLYNVHEALAGAGDRYRPVRRLARRLAGNDRWMLSKRETHAHPGHPCLAVPNSKCRPLPLARTAREALRLLAAEDLMRWGEPAPGPQVHALGRPDRPEAGDAP